MIKETINGELAHIAKDDITALIKDICANDKKHYEMSISNTKAVQHFFQSDVVKDEFIMGTYQKGQTIVNLGAITSEEIANNTQFNYSEVPLGFIVQGEVVVVKGAKGTKKLGEGDFIGLFETSDWLLTNRKRQIGDWILVANSEVKILFFSKSALEATDSTSQSFKKYLIELARADKVPQPITSLPLLDWVASHTTKSRLNDYAIIAHTHLLPNNLPLFRHLAHLVGFGRIYVLEKPYSTVRESYNELIHSGFEIIPVKMEQGLAYEFAVQKSLEILWSKVISEQKTTNFKNLLIIDDGGDVWLSIPWEKLNGINIAGVEQTQRGITRVENSAHRIPPMVSVASSGIKKIIEAQFIGQSVVNKLNSLGILNTVQKVGVIGMGNIGHAVLKSLQDLGKEVIFYDSHINDISEFKDSPLAWPSLDSLINDSDLMIGTTGTDALKGIAFERISGNKVFASASSADVEFASLLKLAETTSNPFETILVNVHSKFAAHILNGGYPINFDRKGNATKDEDIVLTRCLMYIGAMQAVELINKGIEEPGIYNLDRIAQTHTLNKWIEERKNISITTEDVEKIVHFTSLKNGKDIEGIWIE